MKPSTEATFSILQCFHLNIYSSYIFRLQNIELSLNFVMSLISAFERKTYMRQF